MISLIIGILLIKMSFLYSSKEYHLASGIPKKLVDINSNTHLSFYIRANVFQKAISSIKAAFLIRKILTNIIVNNNVSPFNLITVCSYKSISSNCFSQLNKIIAFKQKENQLITNFEYTVSNNSTNYIGIHFSPNKNISYLSIATTVGVILMIYLQVFLSISKTYYLHFHILLIFLSKNIKKK